MSATPPKKSDAEQSVQSPDEETTSMADPDAQGQAEFEVKEQDRWLPIANVARIMKSALPENAKIAKEAKECMQECVSEFISFITSEASEKCQVEKRKTVNGEDILTAMGMLGFENYAEALKIYLARYRETLLANQNRSGGAANALASGEGGDDSTAGNAAGAGFNQADSSSNHMGNEVASGEQDGTQFGYSIGHHNGTANTEF